MPGTDGREGTRRIAEDEEPAESRIVILTTFDLDEYVVEACGWAPARSWSRTPSPSTC